MKNYGRRRYAGLDLGRKHGRKPAEKNSTERAGSIIAYRHGLSAAVRSTEGEEEGLGESFVGCGWEGGERDGDKGERRRGREEEETANRSGKGAAVD